MASPTSAFAQLRATPRVFALAGAMTLSAVGIGVKEVARWRVLSDTFGGEIGIGLAAVAVALAIATSSLVTGRLIGRFDPRVVLGLALGVGVASSLAVAAGLALDALPSSFVIGTALLDGLAMGMGAVAIVKVQAAMVRPGMQGSAEILNILRLGVGGVVGAVIAGMLSSNLTAFLLTAALNALALCTVVPVLRPVVVPRMPSEGASLSHGLARYLRGAPALRAIILADLALALAIPTQLVNILLVGENQEALASASIAAGMLGLLLGRFGLFAIGIRGNSRTVLVGMTVALAGVQLLTAYLLASGQLLGSLPTIVPLIIVSSVLCAYPVGLTAALAQQRVDEEFRGRVSGWLVAGRSVLISVSALTEAWLSAVTASTNLMVILAMLTAAVIVVTRGFRGISG